MCHLILLIDYHNRCTIIYSSHASHLFLSFFFSFFLFSLLLHLFSFTSQMKYYAQSTNQLFFHHLLFVTLSFFPSHQKISRQYETQAAFASLMKFKLASVAQAPTSGASKHKASFPTLSPWQKASATVSPSLPSSPPLKWLR